MNIVYYFFATRSFYLRIAYSVLHIFVLLPHVANKLNHVNVPLVVCGPVQALLFTSAVATGRETRDVRQVEIRFNAMQPQRS